MVFLDNYIEHGNTNHKAPLEGRLGKNDFFVQVKGFWFNQQPPKIKGVITEDSSGQKVLTIGIESGNAWGIVVTIFSVIIVGTSVFHKSWFPLLTIPVAALWFGFGAFLLHVGGLDKTKEELHIIIKEAGLKKNT